VEVPVACGIREGVGSVYVVTVITGTAAKSSNRSGEPSSRFRSRGRWLLTRLLLSVVALLNANPGGSENTVASEGSLLRISQLFEIMRQMLYSSDVVTQVAMLVLFDATRDGILRCLSLYLNEDPGSLINVVQLLDTVGGGVMVEDRWIGGWRTAG